MICKLPRPGFEFGLPYPVSFVDNYHTTRATEDWNIESYRKIGGGKREWKRNRERMNNFIYLLSFSVAMTIVSLKSVLVSICNDITTFVDYLILKLFFVKERQ